jgi:hypothetical protein
MREMSGGVCTWRRQRCRWVERPEISL